MELVALSNKFNKRTDYAFLYQILTHFGALGQILINWSKDFLDEF